MSLTLCGVWCSLLTTVSHPPSLSDLLDSSFTSIIPHNDRIRTSQPIHYTTYQGDLLCETIINIISQLAGVLPELKYVRASPPLTTYLREISSHICPMSLLASRSWHFSTKRLLDKDIVQGCSRAAGGMGAGSERLTRMPECGLWAPGAPGLVRVKP